MKAGNWKKMALTAVCAAMMMVASPIGATAADNDAENQLAVLDKILVGIDKRYAGQGFSATFFQSSTLQALGVTDTATGRLTVKRPGKMLWIYDAPETQTIVTDGEHLWIYRPADNQVMVGGAPAFFRDGKGASFLTDTRKVREQFHVSQVPPDQPDTLRLQLLPRTPQADIARILVTVNKKSYEVVDIVTINTQNDETRIELRDIVFQDSLPDSLFRFKIPEGVDIVSLDE
ncbi:MAG: outer membrane lipoprotein carrier protein LolA [Pseudomonadota bacterium]